MGGWLIGAGPSGVEPAVTLANLLTEWSDALNVEPNNIRIVIIQRGDEILEGTDSEQLRATVEKTLKDRKVAVELLLEATVEAVTPMAIIAQIFTTQDRTGSSIKIPQSIFKLCGILMELVLFFSKLGVLSPVDSPSAAKNPAGWALPDDRLNSTNPNGCYIFVEPMFLNSKGRDLKTVFAWVN